ncbi:dihydrofolate reductase family protein [Catenulispora subtropica]|uniref:Dihydrofolate reductase family protein n=1 Tax=Catenulispora subtropica TaxID=450798 RepID=A0ABN2SN95_9ACTN
MNDVIVRCDMSVSLDGFVCGLEARKPPFVDDRFFRVTDWQFAEDDTAKTLTAERGEQAGAYVLGRRMYDSAGDHWSVESPYRKDVFIVTHRPQEDVPLEDGTVFHFVADGVPAAIEAAKKACPPDKKVHVSGGADVIQQALAADLIDELHVHLAPVLIGQGTRLFDNLPDRMVELEPTSVQDAAGVTHLSFRINHPQKG